MKKKGRILPFGFGPEAHTPPPVFPSAQPSAEGRGPAKPPRQHPPSLLPLTSGSRAPVSLPGGAHLSDPSSTRNQAGLGEVSAPATRKPRGWLDPHAEEDLNSDLRCPATPYLNPSTSRRVASAAFHRRDSSRNQSAAVARLSFRERLAGLRFCRAKSPKLSFHLLLHRARR